MISTQKIFDFFFIVFSSFLVAMAGNYFFEWDFQFGFTVGIILGAWTTIYDICLDILDFLEGDEDEEDLPEKPKKVVKKK